MCGGEAMAGGRSVMVLCFEELACSLASFAGWLDG